MGCHTWFYKRLEKQPTQDEIRETVLRSYNDMLKMSERHLAGDLDEDELEMKEHCPEWFDKDMLRETIELFSRLIKKIKDGKAEKAIRERYAHCVDDDYIYKYHNGIYYQGLKSHDEVFRTTDYPLDKLTSFEDFVKFYESHFCYHDWADKETVFANMKIFWEEYPGGLVDFG